MTFIRGESNIKGIELGVENKASQFANDTNLYCYPLVKTLLTVLYTFECFQHVSGLHSNIPNSIC